MQPKPAHAHTGREGDHHSRYDKKLKVRLNKYTEQIYQSIQLGKKTFFLSKKFDYVTALLFMVQ